MGRSRLLFGAVLRVRRADRKAGGGAEAPPHSGAARVAALVFVLALCGYGQTGPADAAVARRIADLNRQIEALQEATPAEQAAVHARETGASSSEVEERSASARTERIAQMERLAAEAHVEIDSLVSNVVSPGHIDVKSVEAHLRAALGKYANGPPRAFTAGPSGRTRLVVAYALQRGTLMGPDGTSLTLRAYAPKNGRLAPAGSSAAGMDGYGDLQVDELHSPVPGELWLLLRGQATGANGPNIRMRIYAYDGGTFRPVWIPENAWGWFTVQVTEWGFTVDGDYYRENRTRHDRYFLASDGVYRGSPDVR
jgi:hypothetical protein